MTFLLLHFNNILSFEILLFVRILKTNLYWRCKLCWNLVSERSLNALKYYIILIMM